MLRCRTTLVIGAGASCEADFPSGADLLQTIRDDLDIKYSDNGYELSSGDAPIERCLSEMVDKLPGGRGDYLRAAWRIRDAASIGLSIDNILEQHDDNPLVETCGKLAIVRAILRAEQGSFLRISEKRPDQIDLNRLAKSWYGHLVQILTENRPRRDLEKVFDNLSIVCFNYDRAIQHFLPYALRAAWGIELEDGQQAVRGLKILHPYGRVALLPWEDPNLGVEFAPIMLPRLTDLASRIRTFGQRYEDGAALADIRNTIGESDQVIFLGFAFHRQNMNLIAPSSPRTTRILATTLGLPENEKRQIERQIREIFSLRESTEGLVFHAGPCSTLFKENWLTVTAEKSAPNFQIIPVG